MDHSTEEKNNETTKVESQSFSYDYDTGDPNPIAGAHRPPVPFQLRTSPAATQAIQQKPKENKEEGLSENQEEQSEHLKERMASDDSPPDAMAYPSGPAEMSAPPFQLKAENLSLPIQRDEPPATEAEEGIVEGGKITAKDEDAVTNHSGTYEQVSTALSALSEAGSVQAKLPADIKFNQNPGKKTVSTTFTVKIVKTMPVWTEYASIKASIATEKDADEKDYKERQVAAWDRVYASINAHENEHKKDERDIYTALTAQIQGKKESEAMVLINNASDEGIKREAAWHAKKESTIIKWPIVEKGLKKVP